MTDEDLLPLQGQHEDGGFDVVLRGYDRHQVEDYVERVELALGEADRLHREDGERIVTLEEELRAARVSLADAERRASGMPEPLSLVGERVATVLRLAEEEADELVAHARERAEQQTAERSAALEVREAQVAGAEEEAAALRLEAQKDAAAAREQAQQEAADLVRRAKEQAEELLASAQDEAERRRRTAEEDVAILHEDARARGRALIADAEADVAELAHQRDLIAGQLEDLRRTLAAAVKPLHPGEQA